MDEEIQGLAADQLQSLQGKLVQLEHEPRSLLDAIERRLSQIKRRSEGE